MADNSNLESYLSRLYGYAISLCRDPDDAKDLVQECVVRALGARNIPSNPSAYRAWLFRILRNVFFDLCRRRNVSEDWKSGIKPTLIESMEYFQGDERFINALAVKFEMAKLPPAHREIIGLIDLAGLSYDEVSDLLEIPRGTVMSRISRARLSLLKAVEGSNVRGLAVKKRT